MKEINFLQKFAPMGVAAISAIAATASSMILAPSASAVDVCIDTNYDGFVNSKPIDCGDKRFSNFFADDIFDTIDEAFAIENNEIFGELGDFILSYETAAGIVAGPGTTGIISYDIMITDPTKYFDIVSLDSVIDVNADNIKVTKQIDFLEGPAGSILLSSINGIPDGPVPFPGGVTKIRVTDTVTWGTNGGQGELFGFDNSYKQVPEPLTILGTTMALGFGTFFKKRRSNPS